MSEKKLPFATIEEAVEDIRQGRMIVLVDDEDRENEGDLTMAAEKITPEAINFMAKFGRGLICLALTEQRCDAARSAADVAAKHVGIRHAVLRTDRRAARHHHGYRARADRATTILAATDPHTQPDRSGAAGARLSRCARAMAACWCARVRPRRRWTWRGSRGSNLRA